MIDQVFSIALCMFGAWKIVDLIVDNFPFFRTWTYLISYHFENSSGSFGFGNIDVVVARKITTARAHEISQVCEFIQKENNLRKVIILNFMRIKKG